MDEYKRKRDFGVTPEPSDKDSELSSGDAAHNRFVVQEHDATSMHWDFRLEREGVLVSWAIPKGIPTNPKDNRLAVHTEDHPLSYIDFEGVIPEGEYGAGRVSLWDQGTYETDLFGEDKVIVVLHGERARGKYALFRTRGKNWMIHRMDPPLDPTREPLPEHIVPMLAKPSAKLPPNDEQYGYEIKWDGVRAIVYCEGGRVRAESRRLLDVTRQYPELSKFGRAMGSIQAIFDGEIVALDEQGRPSFQRLQARMNLASDSAIRRKMGEIPVTYIIFDLLHLEGHSTMPLPYRERRRLLEEMRLKGAYWYIPPFNAGQGGTMLDTSRSLGLEGIMAKKLDSPYEPGKRSGAWLKIKNQTRQEFIICGWTPGEGGRSGRIGSLMLAYYDRLPEEAVAAREEQRLLYAGNVGTGFTDQSLALIGRMLEPLKREASPFDLAIPRQKAFFVEPQLICEVEFTEWTREGTLRHPSFKGMRPDKEPREVIREPILRPT